MLLPRFKTVEARAKYGRRRFQIRTECGQNETDFFCHVSPVLRLHSLLICPVLYPDESSKKSVFLLLSSRYKKAPIRAKFVQIFERLLVLCKRRSCKYQTDFLRSVRSGGGQTERNPGRFYGTSGIGSRGIWHLAFGKIGLLFG